MFSNDSQRRGGVDLAIVDGDLVMLSSPSQGNIAVVGVVDSIEMRRVQEAKGQ